MREEYRFAMIEVKNHSYVLSGFLVLLFLTKQLYYLLLKVILLYLSSNTTIEKGLYHIHQSSLPIDLSTIQIFILLLLLTYRIHFHNQLQSDVLLMPYESQSLLRNPIHIDSSHHLFLVPLVNWIL